MISELEWGQKQVEREVEQEDHYPETMGKMAFDVPPEEHRRLHSRQIPLAFSLDHYQRWFALRGDVLRYRARVLAWSYRRRELSGVVVKFWRLVQGFYWVVPYLIVWGEA
jgi:hypothetical protein